MDVWHGRMRGGKWFFVTEKMGIPVQPNEAIVGANAFTHSSGIHQDSVIKNPETYEIIDPLDVGVQFNIFKHGVFLIPKPPQI